MARTSRVIVPGHPHHVTQRGNHKGTVFRDDEDRRLYLRLVAQRCKQYPISILAYCLMTNHVHLVAVPENEDSLSKALRDAHGLYALYFNRKYDLTGHLWQGRFYACLLGEEHLWSAIRYVERNPVRAQLVDRAECYPWSSAAAHCRLAADPFLSKLKVPGTISDWSSWLALREPEAELCTLREKTRTGRPFATDEVVQELESSLGRPLRPQKRGRKPAATSSKKGE